MLKAKLDLKTIQLINLFEKITHVKAKYCFDYNAVTIFVVPKALLNKALGKNAININKLKSHLNKKIRIIVSPAGIHDVENFIKAIVFPYEIKKVTLENNELHIFSAPGNKAALIGRNKVRLLELSDIIEKFFGIKKTVIK
ncbi:MAG: hypothetical protein N3G19_00470 [Candidatus Pacearchaeota archaeon]|nr:hypothetical protein [Candidatus Pacearchaeota archaeon]